MTKTLKANCGKFNVVTDTLSKNPQMQRPETAHATQKSLKEPKNVAAMTVPGAMKTALDRVGSQATTCEEDTCAIHLASSGGRMLHVPDLTPTKIQEGTETIMFINTKPQVERLDIRDEQATPNIIVEKNCSYTFTEEVPPSNQRKVASLGFSAISRKNDKIVRDPSGVELLPSCPQPTVIPGIPSSEQQLCGDTVIITNRVTMTRSAPESNSIPGFTTAVNQEPNMVNIFPTCPQVTHTPGLASTIFDSCYSEWVVDRNYFWNKKVQIKEQSISRISHARENRIDTMMLEDMVAMMPTCPRKTQIPGFPSADKQKVSDSPSMACLLPTCPKQTLVTGMPSRSIVEINDSNNWHTLSRMNKVFKSTPLCLIYRRPETYTEHLKDMVHILPACPRTAMTPGFPSAPEKEASFVNLMPTCPQAARAFGMPSKMCIRGADKHCHKAIPLVWLVTLKSKERLFSQIDHKQHIASAHSEMVAIWPSCPMKSSLPGFPSAPQKIAPSMVSISLTCPMASRIAGVPTRKLLSSDNSTTWSVLKTQLLGRPLSNRPNHVMGDLSIMGTDFLNMEDMLPSCPSRATINGFPFAPRKAPNMANLLPTCPKMAKASGFASRKCMKRGEEVWHMGCSLWQRPLVKEEMLIGHCQEIMRTNLTMMKAMVVMVPSCPQKAMIRGFPSAQRQAICVSILSTCPRQSRVPGFPSKELYSSYGKALKTVKHLLLEKPLRKGDLLIKDGLKGHFHFPEKRQWFSSVGILQSCPMNAVISGFPSAPQKLTQSMVTLVHTCPRQTHVSGLPSRICIHSESKGWYAQNNLIKEGAAQKRCTEILQWDPRDEQSTESMAATVSSCPEITRVPGFPSVWRQTLACSLNMQNMQSTCAKISTVSGMPFLDHSKTADWSSDTWSHVSPKLRSVLHFEKMYSVHPTIVKNMISMLPSCPREAHLPGFPSDSSRILADVPHIINLRHICPKHSSCFGIPSRYPTDLDGHIWNEDKGLIWKRQPGNRKSPKVISGISLIEKHMFKIMVSMLPPCPKITFIPGFPSKFQQSKHKSVKKHHGMFKILPSFPNHSEISGLPATNHTAKQDDWQVYRKTIWHKGLGMCPRLQHSWKVNEMSTSDREIMLSMLPPLDTRHALSAGFPSAARLLTERFMPSNQDGPEVIRQRMTSDTSLCSKGSIVPNLMPAHSELSEDKYSSGNKKAKEIFLQPDAIQVSFTKKEVELQSALVSDGHNVERGLRTQNETEDVGTLDGG